MEEILHHLHISWTFILEWYWLPLTIIYLLLTITILIENQNPTKTIAWILVIIFLPIIGIIIYFFFGQKFNKEKNFSRLDQKQQAKARQYWNSIKKNIHNHHDLLQYTVGDYSKVFEYLYHSNSSLAYFNNEIKVYTNGEEKFPAFLDALKSAKNHIHLEYYIFEMDQIGNEIIEILKQKAEEGIKVRMIIDDFGSSKLNKKAKKIFADSLVDFQTMLPVRFNSLANSNYRDHRKILIVDNAIAFVGGINISDKYINTLPYSKNNDVFWRDTSIRIVGNSVGLLQLQFWLHWITTEGELYNVGDYVNRESIENNILNNEIHSIIGYGFSSPGADIPSAMESMILAITLAKRKVRICTPYFIPSEEFKSALMIAVSSGVEVELMLPKKGDSFIVQQASLSFLKPLMKRGVKVFLYKKGFLHAKTIVVDDELAFVGTVNLDNRSFYINFEITSVFYDSVGIQKLNNQFEKDKNVSQQLDYQRWKKINIFQRGLASICRLLAPIL